MPLEFLASLQEIQIFKFPAYRQAGKLQISSNCPISKSTKLLSRKLGHWDIRDYLFIGAWNLVIEYQVVF
jgi:hypothetical protein